MEKDEFFKLRNSLYAAICEIGSAAERTDYGALYIAFNKMNDGLDAIDELGYQLGFLNPETNEVT
jgi:hypothetical protein